MKRLFAAIMAVFLLAAATVPAAAADKSDLVTKEYTFTTTADEDEFEYTENKTIEIDGVEYTAKNYSYELISTEKRIEEKKEYENLTEKEVPESITKGGETLKLEAVDYKENTITDTRVYQNYVTTPAIPNTILVKAGDKSLQAERTETTRVLSDTYNVAFACDGKFYGDKDCMYYVLNGKQIPAESAPTFNGYQSELLAYLDLDPNIYRIDSGSWASDYYTEDGQTVRSAVYNGMQRSNTYTVNYAVTVYNAEAVYSNDVTGDEAEHTVKAIVTYEKVETGLSALAKILIGAGAVILIGLIVAMLMVIRKKRRAEEESAA